MRSCRKLIMITFTTCFKTICASHNETFQRLVKNLVASMILSQPLPFHSFHNNSLASTREKHLLDQWELYCKQMLIFFFADFSSQVYTIFKCVRKEKKLWASGRYQKKTTMWKHLEVFKQDSYFSALHIYRKSFCNFIIQKSNAGKSLTTTAFSTWIFKQV